MDKKPSPRLRVIPFPSGTPNALPVPAPERSADLVSMPWTLARTEDQGGRLIIVVQRRHLHPIVGVTVEETDEAVTVALLAERINSSARSHTLARVHSAHSVMLGQPLGERELRHAPVTYQGSALDRRPQPE